MTRIDTRIKKDQYYTLPPGEETHIHRPGACYTACIECDQTLLCIDTNVVKVASGNFIQCPYCGFELELHSFVGSFHVSVYKVNSEKHPFIAFTETKVDPNWVNMYAKVLGKQVSRIYDQYSGYISFSSFQNCINYAAEWINKAIRQYF